MIRLLSTAAAAITLQMMLVPTPQSQYGHGGGMVLLGPQPPALPPQFNPGQYMTQPITPMTRPQPVMPRPPIQ